MLIVMELVVDQVEIVVPPCQATLTIQCPPTGTRPQTLFQKHLRHNRKKKGW